MNAKISILGTITEQGYMARCPVCGKTNIAGFDAQGRLVHYPNDEVGHWCEHAKGMVSSGGISRPPAFLF